MKMPIAEAMSVYYTEMNDLENGCTLFLLYQMSYGSYVWGSGVKVFYDNTLNQVVRMVQYDYEVSVLRHTTVVSGFKASAYKRSQMLDAYYQIKTV